MVERRIADETLTFNGQEGRGITAAYSRVLSPGSFRVCFLVALGTDHCTQQPSTLPLSYSLTLLFKDKGLTVQAGLKFIDLLLLPPKHWNYGWNYTCLGLQHLTKVGSEKVEQ